jgi:protein-disulfide isomerase
MSMEKKSKRQERREKMKNQTRNNRLIMAGLIVVGAALLVLAVVFTQRQSVEDIKTVAPVSLPNPNGESLGDPATQVSIEVFEDFQCPACQYFSESVEPLVVQYLIETGKAKYTFRNYPFIDGDGAGNGGESDQAANAAMCASEQGKFWEMKAIIYANWNGENQGGLSNRRLQAMAEKIGLDTSAFNQCFDANTYRDKIQEDFEYGRELGVSGTPTVFVNGVRVGEPGKIATFQQISEAVEAAIVAGQ